MLHKKITIYGMKKGIFVFIAFILSASYAMAVNNYIPKKFNTITSHDDVYPYVLNSTQTNTNAKDISAATTRRAVVQRPNAARTIQTAKPVPAKVSQPRRVVQRNKTVARAASNNSNTRANSSRNVRAVSPIRTRTTKTTRSTTTTSSYATNEQISSQRCFADYKACMEDYCRRDDTAYNRCYCSARLAQIDSKYQDKIDELIQQITRLKYNTDATSDEIKEYWDQTVGVYTRDNPWVNIDNALNIEWPDTQSRVRGQNAFNTGHQYCVQHLKACYYMASNLRDAYKSEIARDCETYEKSLQKIQDAAESVIESFQ